MNNHIVINATALKNSGAFTILKQFCEAIPNDKYEYIVFIDIDINLTIAQTNIKVVPKNIKSLFERFIWDAFGAIKWLKKNNISPLATISLQNTNFRTNNSIPNFIYYHQPIPLFKQKWNPLKKAERKLWFYKNIYPSFVKLFINKNTEIFVQINAIKDGFANYYKFSKDKIHIISPNVKRSTIQETFTSSLDKNQLNLLYPATPLIYKNHKIILKALSLLEIELQKKITLHLTCTMDELKSLYDDKQAFFQINYLGKITFNEVLGMYREADALLFPSFIETFGLPLFEAASFGLPIIASDLPYAHEVLRSYEGVHFAPYNNATFWKEEISQLFDIKGKRYDSIEIEESNSWQELFRVLKYKISK